MRADPSIHLYLLAHADDDLFVRPLLQSDITNVRHHIIYLTAPIDDLELTAARQAEARAAQEEVGTYSMEFLGVDNGFADGRLYEMVEEALCSLRQRCAEIGPVSRLVTHAWEGGHQDHDACHLIAKSLASELGVLEASLAVPYYRASLVPLVPFSVMTPLSANGPLHPLPHGLRPALSILFGIRHYPSQIKTFIGLGPGMVLSLIFGRFRAQKLAASCSPQRPMSRPLLYEKRSGVPFDAIRLAAHRLGD